MVRAPPTFTLFPYTTLFRSEKRAHRDVEDSQSATTVKDVLDSGSERQPQKATRQGGQDEEAREGGGLHDRDRKSTRLNSSHTVISYAVFCLKKKNSHNRRPR